MQSETILLPTISDNEAFCRSSAQAEYEILQELII